MKKYISIISLIAIMFVVTLGIISFKKDNTADASVDFGSYQYKVASSSSASATVPYKVVAGNNKILGSIVVASSSGVRLRVYDNALATSTATSTMIADFKANIAEGTYTFDVAVQRGIVLDVPAGFNGVYTVTYK
jgi:hypothetical protein